MEIELKQGEAIEKEVSGDYWDNLLGVIQISQIRGKYAFTSDRIVFRGGFATEIEMPYAEIASIRKCNVGGWIRFMPTGIKVVMKNGKKHYLSVMKRKDIMAMVESKIG